MIKANRPTIEAEPMALVRRPVTSVHARIAGNRKSLANDRLRDAVTDDEYSVMLDQAKNAL